MPGIDISKDILSASPASFVIPTGEIPTVPPEIVRARDLHPARHD